jgi:hypothetical protein
MPRLTTDEDLQEAQELDVLRSLQALPDKGQVRVVGKWLLDEGLKSVSSAMFKITEVLKEVNQHG